MNPIVIIAGLGILYLLTRQTPGGPPAVPITGDRLPTTAPGIAIGEPNPTAGGGGGQYGSGVGDPRTYGGGGGPASYGGGGGGGAYRSDPYAAARDEFLDWVNGIEIGPSRNDPRLRPGVIHV